MISKDPAVSIIVPNFNGRQHLVECFASLRDLDYPSDRLQIICVDNSSSDGSVELLRREFPEVKVVEARENRGFAGGTNLGVRQAEGQYVAFTNNDMRVDPRWVRELIASLDPAAGIVCTAGRILTWEGEEIDFNRGGCTFYGFGLQIGFGAPRDSTPPPGEKLLFACGGSMLVDREIFLELGGFDEDYFAFFEDVDFGWRLHLAGYETAAAHDAVSYHRHHGTAGSVSEFRRLRNYVRNAVATLVKNLSDANLGEHLAAAIMYLVRLGVVESRLRREVYDMWSADEATTEQVERQGLAVFAGLDDVIDALPMLMRKRRDIQERRRRPDAEVFRLFGRPFQPMGRAERVLEAQAHLIRLFGIDERFPEAEAAYVAVVLETAEAHQEVWRPRAEAIARSLSPSFETAATREISDAPEELGILPAESPPGLEALFESRDVCFVHAGLFSRIETMPMPALAAVDLHGVDAGEEAGWLGRALDRADVLLVADDQAARIWEKRVARDAPGRLVVVVPAEELDQVHDICRRPFAYHAARLERRDARTYEVDILIEDWARRVVELSEELAKRDFHQAQLEEEIDAWKREWNTAVEEIQRLKNHPVMRGYQRLRALSPFRDRRGNATR